MLCCHTKFAFSLPACQHELAKGECILTFAQLCWCVSGEVHVDVSTGELLGGEEWGAKLGRRASRLPAASSGTTFATSDWLSWASHTSQEHKTRLPPGRRTHGVKVFRNMQRDHFCWGPPASLALGSGSQGCVYWKGRIWKTAATDANVCAYSIMAYPHRSGHVTPGGLKVHPRVALWPDGLGSPPWSLPRGWQCCSCPSLPASLQQPAWCGWAAQQHGWQWLHGPLFLWWCIPRWHPASNTPANSASLHSTRRQATKSDDIPWVGLLHVCSKISCILQYQWLVSWKTNK